MQDIDARILFNGQHETFSVCHLDGGEALDRKFRHGGYVTVSIPMVDLAHTKRPSQIWKELAADRKLLAADAFWRDENAFAEQAEAIATIAQRIKFRLKSVQALPIDKKARHLVAFPAVSEAMAARLLVSFHLQHQRPMMAAFLDALGIAHEDGMIADEELTAPDASKLGAAATTLAGSYPPADVALYFSTLLWQDPETWGGLADLPLMQPDSAGAVSSRT